MHQFCHASDAVLADLKRRATGRCLQFYDQELPPGASPPRARIGIEVDPRDASATLLVDKGIAYQGDHPAVRQWFKQGRLRFASFEEMCRWIREDLAALYQHQPPQPKPDLPCEAAATPRPPVVLPLVGRDEIVRHIELCLGRELQPAAVVLEGPSGVGKTAICHEVARRWQSASPAHVVLRAELAELMAGTLCFAERQIRLRRVLEQAMPLRSEVLVVLENVHLACAGDALTSAMAWDGRKIKRQPADPRAGLLLQSAIDAGVHLLATTTPRGLQIIEVPEPTPAQMLGAILPAVAAELERRLGVQIPPESQAVALRQTKPLPGAQPGKAIGLLEHAAILAKSRGLACLGPDDLLD